MLAVEVQSGSATLTLDSPLTYAHAANAVVLRLSRSLKVEGANVTKEVPLGGRVLLLKPTEATFVGVEFTNLGQPSKPALQVPIARLQNDGVLSLKLITRVLLISIFGSFPSTNR